MDLSLGWRIAVVALLGGSIGVIRYLDRPAARWGRPLRSRLLLGIPWGSLVSIAIVALVYLVVQGGYAAPRDPLHIPFTSWSYFYPLGVVLAPFSHQGLGHVTGNLLGTVALAPLAEYAFSHFPTRRGEHAFASWRSNPYVRAFVVFPAGVLVVGLLTSVFAWGPIIGFSGVVFAFAGFALVRFPLATVVALTARDTVGTVYYALQSPVVTGSASPSYGPPWWAGIAIQGHLLGFLLGAVLAVAVIATRRERSRPTALRLWIGGLLVATSSTLWAVWWYGNGSEYVLYRGAGVGMVIVVVTIVTLAVRTSERALVAGVTRRHLAVALLVLPVVTMGFVAIPLNATVIDDPSPPGEAVEVDGYAITYAEDVPNQRVSSIDLPRVGEATSVNASGVIVVDDDRTVWTEAVSAGRLANRGTATVNVGGLGGIETVSVRRVGWALAGGNRTYQVAIEPPNGSEVWVYAEAAQSAAPTIAGTTFSIEPVDGEAYLIAHRDGEAVGRELVPAENRSVRFGNVTVTREEDRLVARHDETRVEFAMRTP